MSKWWKCDLQVATPGAAQFRGPSNPPWDLQSGAGRRAAAARYMAAAAEAGIEVVALADHNNADWVEVMVQAGERVGVIVFPGLEVTTGSGADGVHLIIIGDPTRTRDDFNAVLSSACGFGADHPPFDPVSRAPASSPRTAIDILDDLPTGYLVIAPHAFNDNGVASQQTVTGDIRWKILHHDRLGAIDVGDVRELTDPQSWRFRFANRQLDHFPCLSGLAFVSTSDAYSLDRIGARWTWVRMSTPTVEGLRQAFLDHEARIICDWDERYSGSATPNDVSHAWVGRVSLSGLTTSQSQIEVEFHPRLNVLIGGRGSGKSTIVAGLRCLYGDVATLPSQTKAEAAELVRVVFSDATVQADHRLPHSGEQQTAEWTHESSSVTQRSTDVSLASATPTDFKVRIINQKELFERAAHSSSDPHSTSRNLLALVDDELATGSASPGGPAEFVASVAEAQTAWISLARAHRTEEEATAQRDVVAARVGELNRQVAAFDSAESRSRRERNDRLLAQSDALDDASSTLEELVTSLERALGEAPAYEKTVDPSQDRAETEDAASQDYAQLNEALREMERVFRRDVTQTIETARGALATARDMRSAGEWGRAHAEAVTDTELYRSELAELGVDPTEYDRVRTQLTAQTQLLTQLDARRARLPDMKAAADDAWSAVEQLLEDWRAMRISVLDEVAERSGMLRFSLAPRADVPQWTRKVRELLNLRADGFLADVPALGNWLWDNVEPDEQERRATLWREACVTGDFALLASEAGMRLPWTERLADLDPVVRARLGSTVPDDSVEMEFLREGGDPDVQADWKALTAGSPGQRSAAMLSFVLHHGIDPLVLDQPEDDLDTEWITDLVVRQLRMSRWVRQLIVVTHNANIPVNADAERVIVMENNAGGIRVRCSEDAAGVVTQHTGGLEEPRVRQDVQQIMEGGIAAFVRRELRYNNELNSYRAAMRALD